MRINILPMILIVSVLSYNISAEIRDDHPCGVEASPHVLHHNPWLVFLEYYRRGRPYEIRCGATLIDSLHIATAAHCVKNKRLSLVARLGENDLLTDPDCRGDVCADPVVKINMVEAYVHPDYNGRDNDIAILKLEHEAPYTDFIRPVCLPSGKLEPKVTFAASGWGEIPNLGQFSRTKKLIPLPLWTSEDCKNAYPSSVLPKNIICAGGEEDIDTCRGDSGGPLTWVKESIELRGITISGNVRCGTKGTPGLYLNVNDYMDWIRSVVKNGSI